MLIANSACACKQGQDEDSQLLNKPLSKKALDVTAGLDNNSSAALGQGSQGKLSARRLTTEKNRGTASVKSAHSSVQKMTILCKVSCATAERSSVTGISCSAQSSLATQLNLPGPLVAGDSLNSPCTEEMILYLPIPQAVTAIAVGLQHYLADWKMPCQLPPA